MSGSASLIERSTPEGGSLHLGGLLALDDARYFSLFKIAAVLSAVRAVFTRAPQLAAAGIVHKIIECTDTPVFEIGPLLDEAADFIHEELKRGAVLVHCAAGISRSATFVCAYYVKHRRMSVEEALRVIRQGRSIVCPNFGFMQKLRDFERTRLGSPAGGPV